MKPTFCLILLSMLVTGPTLAQPVKPATVQGSVHSIELPYYEPALPEHPNRNLFVNSCTTCHSARYVVMQFPLPRARWIAEVEKMKKAFGCPVEASQRDKLVDYLLVTGSGKASK